MTRKLASFKVDDEEAEQKQLRRSMKHHLSESPPIENEEIKCSDDEDEFLTCDVTPKESVDQPQPVYVEVIKLGKDQKSQKGRKVQSL